eukprot:Lithocolla_globosa_v1_NODE_5_length_12010_cov_23.451945.p9 type:complete len:117 gc:universal NODE_5_length_12010_cov_23.451945:2297-2647(+)
MHDKATDPLLSSAIVLYVPTGQREQPSSVLSYPAIQPHRPSFDPLKNTSCSPAHTHSDASVEARLRVVVSPGHSRQLDPTMGLYLPMGHGLQNTGLVITPPSPSYPSSQKQSSDPT